MAGALFACGLLFLQIAAGQTLGKTPEVHPKLQTFKCTKKGGCKTVNSAVVLDELAHPVHQKVETSLNCGVWGGPPNVTVCPDEATCAKNCIVEGISDYSQYGVYTKGASITLHQLNKAGADVSPRVYLLDESGQKYDMMKLTGNEFAFDVDMSALPCGMNAALYLSEMSETGGRSSLNPGGAAYGSGYCDAQCFTYPFVNGVVSYALEVKDLANRYQGNIQGKGACCNEMDIWEANAKATGMTPHTCNHTGLYQCTGAECTWDGVSDQWGCGYNPYANGNHDYYGPGMKVDTNKKFTVVTQFPTFPNGTLKEIRRLYVQDGKVIQNAPVNITGSVHAGTNVIDTAYCTGGASRFMDLGGMEGIGNALQRGMVLIFVIWWDVGGYMNWLDTGDSGPCNATEGNPSVIVKVEPDPVVTFSNVKVGEIGSTTAGCS
jgi:cellulase